MSNDLTNSIVTDILSLFQIPSDTLQNLLNKHREKKLESSRDILFEEIEQGAFDNINDDDKISLIHRYVQAAMNGSARVNLRLLAKSINSLTKGKKLSKPIYANAFNRFAQALETLSDEEIEILAKLYNMRESKIGRASCRERV